MKVWFKKYNLQFKTPAKTSRGAYSVRPVWYLFIEKDGVTGIGECAPLEGLSTETPEKVEAILDEICSRPESFIPFPDSIRNIPSVRFALETALLDLENGGRQIIFPSSFTGGRSGIPINGLIWMDSESRMQEQIFAKLNEGFHCIKLKIGGINFDEEVKLLQYIRDQRKSREIILRLDANGAFSPYEAPDKLLMLGSMRIHSIEQPIAAGQWDHMARICRTSPIPIALDEELIGINDPDEKNKLLDKIMPQFLVLKPSLHGGISGCREWIGLARARSIRWWITSYLESNIGLNAIAQWAYSAGASGYQGLGTGSLFTNNLDSPLNLKGEELWFNPDKEFLFPENFIQ